ETAAYLLNRSRGMVLTYHSDIVRQRVMGALYTPLLQRVLGRTDRIIATSPIYIESSPILRRWREKCVVVPLGIPLPPPTPPKAQTSNGQRLLFVGQLRYYKGL